MRIRRARAQEAGAIGALLAVYVEQGLLLPCTPEQIRRAIADFLVAIEGGAVVGCVALEFYGARRNGLAEIRSLAVVPGARGTGLGRRLLEAAVKRARRRGTARLFAVTRAAKFFERAGFARAPGGMPAEKLARDCYACPKASACTLVALARDLAPAHAPQLLPVFAPAPLRRAPAPA
jgi:N-acetylglutamate synthase-like GNAT family acetyltransferase